MAGMQSAHHGMQSAYRTCDSAYATPQRSKHRRTTSPVHIRLSVAMPNVRQLPCPLCFVAQGRGDLRLSVTSIGNQSIFFACSDLSSYSVGPPPPPSSPSLRFCGFIPRVFKQEYTAAYRLISTGTEQQLTANSDTRDLLHKRAWSKMGVG